MPRLTGPQAELLAEMEGDGLYVSKWKRYHRTARALVDKGYAVVDEPDYSTMGQDHYVLTDEGKAALRDI